MNPASCENRELECEINWFSEISKQSTGNNSAPHSFSSSALEVQYVLRQINKNNPILFDVQSLDLKEHAVSAFFRSLSHINAFSAESMVAKSK